MDGKSTYKKPEWNFFCEEEVYLSGQGGLHPPHVYNLTLLTGTPRLRLAAEI